MFGNYSARPKIPYSEKQNVVFHQDAGLNADGSPNSSNVKEREIDFGTYNMINCWTPLVIANKNSGCMDFIPKSHKLGILEHKILRNIKENPKSNDKTNADEKFHGV